MGRTKTTPWQPTYIPYPFGRPYFGEDSGTGAPSWRYSGPLKAGAPLLTIPQEFWQEMANTVVLVSLFAKGVKPGDLELWLNHTSAAWAADNVPLRTPGVPFTGVSAAVTSHSPEGGSHNPGPHAITISVGARKNVASATVLCQAIYVQATDRYPKEYTRDYGVVSGPWNHDLCISQGVL